ncbi:hypothetical protein AXF14_08695 [Actinomyces radicidentis]|uniref:Signal peptidase I n=1 Tax=Actinomyces radicidentis TaxID=111015 RepID=A0A120KLA9_ACTRD|nr:signal peptidase I [Actinomyces radicidentis]AMD87649.1 hypothetical protein AXF14_08695 [Actinomyces radicidentis]
MSTADRPRAGADGGDDAAPARVPEPAPDQAIGAFEDEPLSEIVALRRAPVEDADLALISPYHEDPEVPEEPALGRTGTGDAHVPLPDDLVDDPADPVLDEVLVPTPRTDSATTGVGPATPAVVEPVTAPAPVRESAMTGEVPVVVPASAGATSAGDPAGAAASAEAPTPVVEESTAEPGLAAPTDIDAAGPVSEEGEELLRVAETPDVAVPVAPVRLPPSYPPVHRPEPLPVPARAGEAPTAEREPRRWGGTIGVVLVVVLISALLKTFVVQTFTIPSSSMETTLMTGDRVAVSVWDADDVQRGDIVVFKDPDHWLDVEDPTGFRGFVQDALILIHLLPEDSGHHLIKRVIGTAGDHVVSDGRGRITVNGVAVDETYVEKGELPSEVAFDVTVPDGYLWVMGDNRANSADSRYHQNDSHQGFVPVEDVVGVARDVIWPVTQWADVDDGTKVFDDVPAPTGKAPSLATPAAEDGA